MTWFPQLRNRLPHELMEDFVRPPALPEDELPAWFEEAAVRMAKAGNWGVGFLLWQLPGADEDRARAILVGLSFAKRLNPKLLTELPNRVRRMLDDQRPLVVAAAVDTLRALECREALNDVLKLRAHASPYVVGGVLRFLSWCWQERARPLLEEALRSEEPIIRQNAVDELDELECVDALPHIRPLLNDPDQDVRRAAEMAVGNLEELGRSRQVSSPA